MEPHPIVNSGRAEPDDGTARRRTEILFLYTSGVADRSDTMTHPWKRPHITRERWADSYRYYSAIRDWQSAPANTAPLVQLRHGVHEFHDRHRFANAGSTKKACLSAADERTKQVHHLDPRLDDIIGCHRILQTDRRTVHIAVPVPRQRFTAVQHFSENIEWAPIDSMG